MMRTEKQIRDMIARHEESIALCRDGKLVPSPTDQERRAMTSEFKVAIDTLKWVLEEKP